MKRIIYILTLILTFSLLMTAMISCDNEEEKKEEEIVYGDYSVTVIDGLGAPMSQVVVKFVYPDGTSKTRITEADGVVHLKNVPLDNYKVVVEQGFSTAVITGGEFKLTKDVTSLRLILRDGSKTQDVYGDVPENAFAYPIGESEYNIPVDVDERFYFIFKALKSGVYRVTLDTESDMTVGYYGIPFYVQANHLSDEEYDGKTFDLVIQDPATPYVIGIDSKVSGTAKLKIERISDAPFDPQHAPWTTVPAEFDIVKCELDENVILTDLDITDATLSVSLGEDGYYYTNDGKLVYVRLGSTTQANYLDVSIAFIAGCVDPNFGQNFGGYVYDENGEFTGKYSYNEMIESYFENCDGKGVCPLTEELAEAIKCHGTSTGWWNQNAANYLFSSVDEITENAWLFLCCTVE